MFNDVFRQDLFGVTSLTSAIQEVAFTPTMLSTGRMAGLFGEEGIPTVDAAIEYEKGVIHLVPVLSRGAPGFSPTQDKRRMFSVRCPHLPQSQGLMADQVQGVRQFGTESQVQTIESRRDRLLAKMRRAIDYTRELHRLTAVMGSFYDANAGITSLFTMLEVTQVSLAMALPTQTTKIRQRALDIIESVEAGLDGVSYTGIEVICGAAFWRELLDHAMIKETYLNQAAASELRGAVTTSFEFGGITWNRYRGNTACRVPTDEAFAIPTGVDEMFITRYAPANYIETVNTDGLPYYAKAEPMKMGKGLEIEAQSNPLNMNTRPHGVIRLTRI